MSNASLIQASSSLLFLSFIVSLYLVFASTPFPSFSAMTWPLSSPLSSFPSLPTSFSHPTSSPLPSSSPRLFLDFLLYLRPPLFIIPVPSFSFRVFVRVLSDVGRFQKLQDAGSSFRFREYRRQCVSSCQSQRFQGFPERFLLPSPSSTCLE